MSEQDKSEQNSSLEKRDVEGQRQLSLQAVRQALENLYANVELVSSDLAISMLEGFNDATVTQRAQTLRNLLLDAIESLRPLRPAPPHVFGAERSYEVLSLRYVSGHSVDQIAEYLSLSERQIFRDLRRGEESLVQLLKAESVSTKFTIRADSTAALQEEIGALAEKTHPVDLSEYLQNALLIIQPILNRQGLRLEVEASKANVWVMSSPGILTEVLIQVLSAVVQQCNSKLRLSVGLTADEKRVELCATAHELAFSESDPLLHRALQTARSLGFEGKVTKGDRPNTHTIVLSVNAVQPRPILVIEDNTGACELYQRFLQGSEWSMVSTSELSQALTLVQSIRPVAIILDILMSDMDGWSILQALQLRSDIAEIPVIVCSVISDPQLARALGASASLSKPLSRLELLGVLKQFASSRTWA